jgi:hypothetical protein
LCHKLLGVRIRFLNFWESHPVTVTSSTNGIRTTVRALIGLSPIFAALSKVHWIEYWPALVPDAVPQGHNSTGSPSIVMQSLLRSTHPALLCAEAGPHEPLFSLILSREVAPSRTSEAWLISNTIGQV